MSVVFQKIIRKEDLGRNPQVLYVFSDNRARKGYIGQAHEMRGEKNGVGVAVSNSEFSTYTDEPGAVVRQCKAIDKDMKRLFAHIQKGGVVVWPSDGIGCGTAELQKNSPMTFDHLQRKLLSLIHLGRL